MEPVNLKQIQNTMQQGSVQRAQSVRNTAETPDATKATGKQTESRTQEAQSRAASQIEDAAAKGIYGDVLDISEDGDTVTARPEALQKLDDGLVMLRSDAQEKAEDAESVAEEAEEASEKRAEIAAEQAARAEAAKEAREAAREDSDREIREDEEAEKEALTSLNGYSDDMIDTLYRQGKIDGRQYRSEEERRSRLEEMRTPDEDSDKAKETRQAQIEENNSFEQKMGELGAQADQDEQESEALITAAENGRVDIMKDIIENTTN